MMNFYKTRRAISLAFVLLLVATIAFGTITNTTLPPQQYAGNDLATDFPITFDYNAESDLSVSLKVDATGVVTDWTQDALGDAGYTIVSGEVIANTAPATGTTLTIDCETAITQTVDLKNNRKTAAEIYETAYDKVTLIGRDNAAKLERALVAPASGDPTVSYIMPDYDASAYIQWHPTSKELRNASPVSISQTVGTDVGDVVALVDDGAGNGVLPSDQLNLTDDDSFATVTDTQAATGESIKAYTDSEISTAKAEAIAEGVVQVVTTQTSDTAADTGIIPYDDTIPQITEGSEIFTRTITPTSATNRLLISVVWNGVSETSTRQVILCLFQDTTANALAVANHYVVTGNQARSPLKISYDMVAGTTSEITFRVRIGINTAGTIRTNGVSGGRLFGGVMFSGITVIEYKP